MSQQIFEKLLDVMRYGLGDYTCPPTGQVVLFHAFAVPTKWIVNQGRTHGFIMKNSPEYVIENLRSNNRQKSIIPGP